MLEPRRARAHAAGPLPRGRGKPEQPPFAVFSARLRPPVPARAAVSRTALLNRLRAEPANRLVTVLAPPGYGKTTLLAQWAERDVRPVAWLTVDAHDADPLILIRHLTLAVRGIGAAGRVAVAALREDDPAIWSHIAPQLVSGLSESREPFVLVLDNADLLPGGDAADLVAAIADGIPAGSTLALAGRCALPIDIARRRASGDPLELAASDLALSLREVKLYATALRPGLGDADIAELHRHTEGWPAAVGLAVRGRADHPGGDQDPPRRGVDRTVSAYIRDELVAEIDEGLAAFLRRTAILDTLTAPLCDALLGRRDGAAQLAALERDGRFLIPLDRQGTEFRYHRLVREVLRHELAVREPASVDDLHRRAATWYQRRDDVVTAVPFALASGDADRAAAMITATGMRLAAAGQGETVIGWLDDLAGQTALEAHPAAAALGGWVHALAGRTGRSEAHLEAGEAGVAAGTEPAVAAAVAVLRAALCQSGVDAMEEAAAGALAELRRGTHWHAIALMVRGAARMLHGDRAGADDDLLAAGRSAAAAGATEVQLLALGERAWGAAQAGDLAAAAQFAFEGRDLARRSGPGMSAATALIHAEAAAALLRHGRWDDARAALAAGDRAQLTLALPWLTTQVRLSLAAAYLALRDRDAAGAQLADAERVLELRPMTAPIAERATAVRREVAALQDRADTGTTGLSRAELRLVPLLATHLTFVEIGERLCISRNTVKTQAISIYRKLGTTSRSGTIERAAELGLVDDEAFRSARTREPDLTPA